MAPNPFPAHRPAEDPRACRVEPLSSSGLGGRPTATERPTIGLVVAMIAGVVVPLAIGVHLLSGLPVELQVAIGAGFVGAAILAVARARGARRRAAARAATRAERLRSGA
jgi:hypothetical protein